MARPATALVAALALCATGAPQALAAPWAVFVRDKTVFFKAASNTNSDVTIILDPTKDQYVIIDERQGVTARCFCISTSRSDARAELLVI